MHLSPEPLIVKKRLPFQAVSLDRKAGPFISAVREAIREARSSQNTDHLELADIGFVPGSDYIEIRLYFRKLPADENLIKEQID